MSTKLRFLPLLIALPALSPAVATAAPMVSIGDSVDIFFNGSVSARWDSNIFRDENEEAEDVIFTFSPGFEMNIGRGLSNTDLTILTRYDLLRYDDFKDLNTELFHINLAGSYRGSRLELNVKANYDEEQSTTGDANVQQDIIEYTAKGASLNGEYTFSPKFSVGSGVRYSERSYEEPYDVFFSDRDSLTIPVDLFYELTPKVDLSVGYQYTDSSVDDRTNPNVATGNFFIADLGPPVEFGAQTVPATFEAYDYDSHFFNVGLRGELLPKLSGHFKTGYRYRSSYDYMVRFGTPTPAAPAIADRSVDSDSQGMLGLDADLFWETTPKLTTRIGLSRDFGVAGNGTATENSSIDVNMSYAISDFFFASSNLGYTLRDYDSGREDNQYLAGLRLSYAPDRHWRLSTGYTYSENDSDADLDSYKSHMVDISASLRY